MTRKTQAVFTYASIAFLLLITASCRSTRLLEDDQVLVRRVALEGIAPEYEEGAEAYIQRDIRPNSIVNLIIYNLANAQNGRYRTDKIRNVGEAPRLLDSALVDLSAQQISRYLFSKGYFDAQVDSRVDIRNQKAKITFDADPGEPEAKAEPATPVEELDKLKQEGPDAK